MFPVAISVDDATIVESWWRHAMETLSALLALCKENPPMDFSHKVPVMRGVDVSFAVNANKLLNKVAGVLRQYDVHVTSLWYYCRTLVMMNLF